MPIGRPLKIAQVWTVEVGNACLAGTIGTGDPDLPTTGPIADERNAPTRRIAGVLVAHGGRDDLHGRATPGSRYAINVEILNVIQPRQSVRSPADHRDNSIASSLNNPLRMVLRRQRESP